MMNAGVKNVCLITYFKLQSHKYKPDRLMLKKNITFT
jgi:hypothetical protein